MFGKTGESAAAAPPLSPLEAIKLLVPTLEEQRKVTAGLERLLQSYGYAENGKKLQNGGRVNGGVLWPPPEAQQGGGTPSIQKFRFGSRTARLFAMT